MKQIKKITLFILALTAFTTVQAAIVTSATFTHMDLGHLIDMDAALAPGYSAPTDWQIYEQDAGIDDAKVYTQKSGKDDLFILHKSSSDIEAHLTFQYTWSSGDPIVSGTSVEDLGFEGYGNFAFDAKNIAAGDAGLVRLYISTGSNAETFTLTSQNGESEGTVNVSANNQGYIDVVYTNTTAIGSYIRIAVGESNANAKIGVYAFAIAAPVPEPVVMGFIGIVGLFVIVVGRIFRRA